MFKNHLKRQITKLSKVKYPEQYEVNIERSNNTLENSINKHGDLKYEGTDPLPDAKRIFVKS